MIPRNICFAFSSFVSVYLPRYPTPFFCFSDLNFYILTFDPISGHISVFLSMDLRSFLPTGSAVTRSRRTNSGTVMTCMAFIRLAEE